VQGVRDVEAACNVGLNAIAAFAEAKIATVEAAGVTGQVLIESSNSTNSALQSKVSAQASEVQ
jgi:hypothetical protein